MGKATRTNTAWGVGAFVVIAAAAAGSFAQEGLSVHVEVCEDVYTFVSPNNGSGPMWSYGCTSIVRAGDDVVVSEMETGEGVPLLCNTRWRLLRRGDGGWETLAEPEGYRQREPCSLGRTSDDTVYLYVNDSTEPPGVKYGACEPYLLQFTLGGTPPLSPTTITPVWQGETNFTDHSYRGYSTDSGRDEILMLNINSKTSGQHWCRLDAAGDTLGGGVITFPLRACYSQVALKDGAGYVLAVSDIVEPVEEWRQYKFEQTKRKWDYVFRILYLTWTPDLSAQPFAEPIEVANVDATAGHIRNEDLWIAPTGEALIMYTVREVQSAAMRDEFFPEKSIVPSLHLATVKDGAVVSDQVILGEEAGPGCARFHEAPDDRVYALAYAGSPEPRNVLVRVFPEPEPERAVPVAFEKPFTNFMLATVRAGNEPSRFIDVLGHSAGGNVMTYARVRLGE